MKNNNLDSRSSSSNVSDTLCKINSSGFCNSDSTSISNDDTSDYVTDVNISDNSSDQMSNGNNKKTSIEDAFDINGGFTEKEKNVLSSGVLRNREYLIERNSQDESAVFLGLADLLFSFCFDHR